MKTLVNLTPHAITVAGASGETLAVLPPSGEIARVSVTRSESGQVAGLPVFRSVTGDVVGLPTPADGVGYVVSAMVRAAVPTRRDVFSPGTLLRGADGQPVGCVGLEANP